MPISCEIDDPRKWRISMSGYSIKTGWGDEKRIVAKCPVADATNSFRQWLEDAQVICDAHNAALERVGG